MIKAKNEGAHLRGLIVSSEHRRKGIGGNLIQKGIKFCMDNRLMSKN